MIEAAFVAGEEEVSTFPSSLTSASPGSASSLHSKSFNLNLKSMHEIRESSGTARPIRRMLTSQLKDGAACGSASGAAAANNEGDEESEEKKQKRIRHLEMTAQITKELLPILMEVFEGKLNNNNGALN